MCLQCACWTPKNVCKNSYMLPHSTFRVDLKTHIFRDYYLDYRTKWFQCFRFVLRFGSGWDHWHCEKKYWQDPINFGFISFLLQLNEIYMKFCASQEIYFKIWKNHILHLLEKKSWFWAESDLVSTKPFWSKKKLYFVLIRIWNFVKIPKKPQHFAGSKV